MDTGLHYLTATLLLFLLSNYTTGLTPDVPYKKETSHFSIRLKEIAPTKRVR